MPERPQRCDERSPKRHEQPQWEPEPLHLPLEIPRRSPPESRDSHDPHDEMPNDGGFEPRVIVIDLA